MGTIVERPRKNGSTAYLAKISIMRDGKIVHRENKTFDRRPAASAWIEKREAELSRPGEIERSRGSKPTLLDAIVRFMDDSEKDLGRTKRQVLNTIKALPIAQMPCDEIASQDIVSFAKQLLPNRKPQTVASYMSHLSAIFDIARPAWGFNLREQEMADAFKVAGKLGLTSKSDYRERRPTLEELDQIMTHFARASERRRDITPMTSIVAFAILSTRRQEEITRLTWADLDEQSSRIWVRDLKHPRRKIGNDMLLDVPPEAMAIIQAQPRRDARIFPYNPDTVSANFTRAIDYLQIENLKFHDLRHEGVSRLFEMGKTIPHVAAVSGHRSWQSLQRYTHIRQTGDKYAGWQWMEFVTQPPQPVHKRQRVRRYVEPSSPEAQ